MKSEEFSFGAIRIDGATYEHDVVIDDFDVCLRDDHSGDVLRFSPFTGEYQFTRSGSSDPILVGKAVIDRVGCTLTLHDARVSASLTGCPFFGPPSCSETYSVKSG